MDDRQTILIVDDSEMNRAILMDILGEEKYLFQEAENGREAVERLQRQTDIDLVLLDVNMPMMDGFGVLEMMGRSRWLEEIPVIMISADEDPASVERAYDLGATDYIRRPFDTKVVRRRVGNTLMLYAKQKRLSRLVAEQVYEKEKASDLMISILSHVVEFRNSESGLHVMHIRTITELVLRHLVAKTDRYKLTENDISLICTASALHDIGKISIPDEILNKPGKLTNEEFEVMKTHTVVGAAMLKDVPVSQDEPLVKAAHEICRWHHERWDGRGYPDGLKGDEIPISAQVVALADVYDALTSERCYKKAFDHDTAVRMILNGECGAFAPLLMECLSEVQEDLRREMGRTDGEEHDHRKEARRLSDEILQGEALPKSDRSQRMLDMERAKCDFFSAMAGGIRFDYDVASGRVSMTEWDRDGRRHDRRMDLEEARDFRILSQSDQKRLLGLVEQATVKKPEVQMTALLPTGRICRWHRIDVLTIWSKEPPYQRIGVVGLIVDVHDGAARQRALTLGLGTDSTTDAAKTIQSLSEVFDLVRLVDPVKTEILELGEDGVLKSTGAHCYGVWTAQERCDDCISATVFQDHGCRNKLQFANNEIYHVIARYAEVDGRPCVLEMVSKLDEGPWVDNGGKRLLLEKVADCRENYFLDPVSGAYSRRYFENYAARLETADGVMMMDVDYFKSVNDNYGHPVGDEALRLIADTVRACVRDIDMLVRFGGDEFLLVFSDHISRDAFWERMGTIKQKVSQLALPDHPALRLSISIGGAYRTWPLAEAIKQADRQMYEDKRRTAALHGTAIDAPPRI